MFKGLYFTEDIDCATNLCNLNLNSFFVLCKIYFQGLLWVPLITNRQIFTQTIMCIQSAQKSIIPSSVKNLLCIPASYITILIPLDSTYVYWVPKTAQVLVRIMMNMTMWLPLRYHHQARGCEIGHNYSSIRKSPRMYLWQSCKQSIVEVWGRGHLH